MAEKENDKNNFVREIAHRLKVPLDPFNYGFWGYFIGILIGIGGLGIWVSCYNVSNSPTDHAYKVAISISTYFMASLTRSFIDLNLLTDFFNRVSMIIYSVIILALGLLFFFLTNITHSNWAFLPAILGFVLSTFTWYLAYADSDKFNEDSYNEKIRKEGKKKHGAQWGVTPGDKI